MRLIPTLLAAFLVAGSAHAQTGSGSLRGIVMPVSAHHIGGFGDWSSRLDAAAPQAVHDTTAVATIVLTPIATLRASAARSGVARGMYGRYDLGRLSMGRYRMRVEAEGCAPYETDVVIVSDSQSVQHIALQCTWGDM